MSVSSDRPRPTRYSIVNRYCRDCKIDARQDRRSQKFWKGREMPRGGVEVCWAVRFGGRHPLPASILSLETPVAVFLDMAVLSFPQTDHPSSTQLPAMADSKKGSAYGAPAGDTDFRKTYDLDEYAARAKEREAKEKDEAKARYEAKLAGKKYYKPLTGDETFTSARRN